MSVPVEYKLSPGSHRMKLYTVNGYKNENKPTIAELIFFKALVAACIPFKWQPIASHSGKFRILDFAIPGHDINIEIDGGYHEQSHIKINDSWKDWIAERKGFRTLRLTNEEVSKDTKGCIKRLKDMFYCEVKLLTSDCVCFSLASRYISEGSINKAIELFD